MGHLSTSKQRPDPETHPEEWYAYWMRCIERAVAVPVSQVRFPPSPASPQRSSRNSLQDSEKVAYMYSLAEHNQTLMLRHRQAIATMRARLALGWNRVQPSGLQLAEEIRTEWKGKGQSDKGRRALVLKALVRVAAVKAQDGEDSWQ